MEAQLSGGKAAMPLLLSAFRWSEESICWLSSLMLGSVDTHRHIFSHYQRRYPPPLPPHTPWSHGRADSECYDCFMCSTCLAFVALYQSAGSVSFWLINVQFEVYYEPAGFNYHTITQSIPCHLIFMAFITPWYVQLPNSMLNAFLPH